MRVTLFAMGFTYCLLLQPLVGGDASAATLANFDDGNGSGSPDAFPGTAGAGWAGGWTNAPLGTVINTNPWNGGGKYLSVSNSGAGSFAMQRQFGLPDPTKPHTIRWQWRFDGDFNDFTSAGEDRIHFFGDDNGSETGSGGGNSWLIGVTNNRPGFGAVDNEFYFFDGTGGSGFSVANMFDTDLLLQDDTIYDFEVFVDPDAGTYNATVSDGINTVSAFGLGFRNQNAAPGTYDFVGFGLNASGAGDDLTFALDSISISQIPEPASFAIWSLLGLGLAGMGYYRTRRKS